MHWYNINQLRGIRHNSMFTVFHWNQWDWDIWSIYFVLFSYNDPWTLWMSVWILLMFSQYSKNMTQNRWLLHLHRLFYNGEPNNLCLSPGKSCSNKIYFKYWRLKLLFVVNVEAVMQYMNMAHSTNITICTYAPSRYSETFC